MKYKIGLLTLFLSVLFVISNGNALAADWPNNAQWGVSGEYSLTGEAISGHADTNMKIMLEAGYSSAGNLVHDDRDTYFNAYIDGNATVNGAAKFPINFVRYNPQPLDPKPADGVAGATMSATVGASTASTTSDANFTLNVRYDQGTYNSERNITVYTVYAAVSELIPVPVNAANEKLSYGYHFRVWSPNVYKFGFIGGDGKAVPEDYRVPFGSVITGRGTYQDLAFKMISTRSCSDPAREGVFTLFDSDNEPSKNIQNGFAWRSAVPAGGWTAYGGEYNALRMRLLDVTNNVVNPTDKQPTGANYWDTDGTYQVPVNTTSNINMTLKYSVAANSRYTLQMNPLGIANFVALGFPFDEDPDRLCNWTVVGDTNFTGDRVVLKGSGNINFTHTLQNKGDSSTNANVVATRYVNGVATADTFTLPSGTVDEGIVTSPVYPFNPNVAGRHCEYIRYTPISNTSAGPSNSAEECVYVIDVTANPPTAQDFEKGSSAPSLSIGVNVDDGGGGCPPESISFNVAYDISGGIGSGNMTVTYGPGNCGPTFTPTIDPTTLDTTPLNNAAPGDEFDMTVTVLGSTSLPAKLRVIEVPFTRFYGNDIYATVATQGVRFNDSFNTDTSYDDRGSVSQYAAITSAVSNLLNIDTSAFRSINPGLPTQPTNGLDSPNSQIRTNLAAVNSASVYADVISDLPECTTVIDGKTLPVANGCRQLSNDPLFTSGNVKRVGGGADLNYNNKVTIVNQDASIPIVIDKNISNTTGANIANPINSGVLLIVSAGDIIIDRNVQRIDAILVSGKDIYTCGFSTAPTYGIYANNVLHQQCRQTLTINGSVSAKNIHFQRAIGSRLLSQAGVNSDLPNGYQKCAGWHGVMNCNVRNYGTATNAPGVPAVVEQNNSGGAAEIINFPAYLYFATPYLQDNGESGAESDALFQAPPRL